MKQDRFAASDVKNQRYSDFLNNLNLHPASGDVVRYVNENAVIRSIKNLLSTMKGERHYQPQIGGNLKKLLFEPMGTVAETEMSRMIHDTVAIYEPRAKLLKVDVIPDYDGQRYRVNIVMLVVNKSEPVEFGVTMFRSN